MLIQLQIEIRVRGARCGVDSQRVARGGQRGRETRLRPGIEAGQRIGASAHRELPLPSSVDFQLLSGAELIASFESSPGKHRAFCRRCGSPLYSRKDALPGVLRLRAGLINEALAVRPVAHYHTGSKANWWPIDDDLPQFEAGDVAPPRG